MLSERSPTKRCLRILIIFLIKKVMPFHSRAVLFFSLFNLYPPVKTSVDNTEWVSSTCHSNLSDEKLPVYFKANKMNFLVKPECLNFTSLQEILKSLCIPFMQIILWELLRGGQLSIHDNVVNNVPADVNSVVNTLPKPINESQTIHIKLKSTIISLTMLDQEKCWKQQNIL